MKNIQIILLLIFTMPSLAQKAPNQVNLENISLKGLDKNVAMVFEETKEFVIQSRQKEDKDTEVLATKKWCYLLHNFDFLSQAKECYLIIGLKIESETQWPYLYAKAAMKQGDIADAIVGFQQTIKREGGYLPAHYNLIQIAIDAGDLLTAFEFYGNVPAELLLTPNMLNIAGDLFTQVENYHVANGYYKQALKLVSGANSLNYKIGQNYIKLDQMDLAENYLVNSGQIGISLPDPYFQAVKDTTVGEIPYLIKAKLALTNSDFKQAINLYNKALEYNPDSQSAKINIAVAYFQDKQIDKARTIYEKINFDSPDNLKVIYNLAIIAKFQNKLNNAVAYFESFREINNQDSDVNNELAELYYNLRKYPQVIKIANEPTMQTDEKSQVLKAKSLVQEKQYAQAVDLLLQINQYKPNNNEVLLILAKIYSQVPDTTIRNGDKSLKYAQNAFDNDPNRQSYWQLLMALDESEKCQKFQQIMTEFAQQFKTDKQQVLNSFDAQRGEEFRCES